jgi:predicted glutamine amidotransferase
MNIVQYLRDQGYYVALKRLNDDPEYTLRMTIEEKGIFHATFLFTSEIALTEFDAEAFVETVFYIPKKVTVA